MSGKTKKTVYIVLILILAAAFVLQIIFEGFSGAGLYILVGFVGSFVCILIAKKLLAPFVQRDPHYYDDKKLHFSEPDFFPEGWKQEDDWEGGDKK